MIPTTSLMMLEESVRDKLDDVIFKLRAKHTWQSESEVQEILPYLYVSRPATRQELKLNYSWTFKAHRTEAFSLSKVVEQALTREATEMYISSLAFRFVEKQGVQTDEKRVYFENVAPPVGGDVEDLVRRLRLSYLRRHGISELPTGERLRILRFVEARTRDNRRIDASYVSTTDFLGWLTKKTHGLVMRLQESQVRHVGFVGRRYELGKDSVWTRYLEEA
jgi:hypothetical protein